MELSALQGAQDTLRHVTHALVELSFVELYLGQALAGQVISFLIGHGFGIVDISHISRDKAHNLIQADFLFEKTGACKSATRLRRRPQAAALRGCRLLRRDSAEKQANGDDDQEMPNAMVSVRGANECAIRTPSGAVSQVAGAISRNPSRLTYPRLQGGSRGSAQPVAT